MHMQVGYFEGVIPRPRFPEGELKATQDTKPDVEAFTIELFEAGVAASILVSGEREFVERARSEIKASLVVVPLRSGAIIDVGKTVDRLIHELSSSEAPPDELSQAVERAAVVEVICELCTLAGSDRLSVDDLAGVDIARLIRTAAARGLSDPSVEPDPPAPLSIRIQVEPRDLTEDVAWQVVIDPSVSKRGHSLTPANWDDLVEIECTSGKVRVENSVTISKNQKQAISWTPASVSVRSVPKSSYYRAYENGVLTRA